MVIESVRIRNYKSWKDSEEVILSKGLNIVVGKNNSGKTAFLEALSLMAGNVPHLTMKSKPTRIAHFDPHSHINLRLTFEASDLQTLLTEIKGQVFAPLVDVNIPHSEAIALLNKKLIESQKIFAEFHGRDLVRADFSPSFHLEPKRFIQFTRKAEDNTLTSANTNILYEQNIGTNELCRLLIEGSRKKIYLSKAERYNISSNGIQDSNRTLEQNSRNLAQVLHTLHSRYRRRFDKIESLLRKIFPQIQGITVPVEGSTAQVMIWTIDPGSERDDLAIPLSHCGTGVGQVLSMLFIIVSADEPQCIVIDEPQSFLHPGAVRSLADIFNEYPIHQYIIATHASNLLTGPNSHIYHVTYNQGESSVRNISPKEAQLAKGILEDIGIKLSDVFGADRIIWVEGITEQECYKLILAHFGDTLSTGTEIISVRNTGDLEGKHAQVLYEVYTKLSNGVTIIPPAIGFIFDKENRSEKVMKDLTRMSKGKAHFLKRRMFENYLLNSAALAAVIKELDNFCEIEISEKDIQLWIEQNGADKSYFEKGSERPFTANWFALVHAAKLLDKMFTQLSKGTYKYDKRVHGLMLTNIILAIAPQELDGVYKLIKHISSTE